MALRTGRCGERFQCCLPAERKRINNVVLVRHKGHPALVFLLAKDASLPEPVGTDPLFPHNLGVSQISLDRLGSRVIPLPLLSAFSTFLESQAFLGGPEEKPSKLPRMPLNRKTKPLLSFALIGSSDSRLPLSCVFPWPQLWNVQASQMLCRT